MDARRLIFAGLTAISLSCTPATAATFQTRNFVVQAPSPEVAERVGRAAEDLRRDLAEYWFGQKLPNWSSPCRLRVRIGSIGAGGETKFRFIRGEVVGWNMYVQGSLDRVLDSVLPHEVNHTIFACHFRRPLPRWADEGAATLFEHRSEQRRQLDLLNDVVSSRREFIPLTRLLQMTEYPEQRRPMLILYAQGYALVDFLIQQQGKERYLKFLEDGHRAGWQQAITSNYAHNGIAALEQDWRGWILAGMPRMETPGSRHVVLARAGHSTSAPEDNDHTVSRSPSSGNATARGRSPGSRESAGRSEMPRQPRTRPGLQRASGAVIRLQSPDTAVPKQVTSGDSSMWNAPYPNARRMNSAVDPRQASFEAPAPQPHSGPGRQSKEASAGREESPFNITGELPPRRRSAAWEPTSSVGTAGSTSARNTSIRSGERHAQTGSVPQWAGFAGARNMF